MAVVGASGAGKSSLVQAGLLPRLRAGVAGKVFTDITIKPSARGDNPFLALAAALQERLGKHGETEQDLANRLRSEPDLIREKLLALTPTRLSHCLLIIDQYEEVFAATVSTSMRQDFAQKLAHCIEHARLHVLLSVREDFYSDLFSQQPLTASLQQGGTFPLPAPDRMQLRQMFSKPAQLAGLQLDDGLIDTVLDATGTGSAALALAAYTFYLLYEQGQGLTLAGYQAIGGVDGAIRKRVALAMTGIDTDLLQQLFAHIVEVKISEQAASQTIIRVRRRALKTYLPVAVQTLAQKLADARLLVISGEQESQKTVEIAHESVLTVWEALNQWLNKQEQALRNRSLLEQTALVWLNANKNRQHLHSGKTLKALQTAMRPISPTAVAYLAACRSKQRLIVSGLALLGLVLLLSLIPLKFIHDSNYESPMAFKGWLTRMNLLPVPIPDMVSIPARQFMMGSVDGVGEADEHPRHLVTLAAFDLGKYELSFAEYDLFAAATGRAKPGDYSFGNDRPTMPAINISWQDAIAYCQWLSEKTGQRFRLPTEAEWEYAARAGTDSDYYWGNAVQAGQTESACDYTNVYDLDAGKKYTTGEHFACHDGYTDFAPVKAVFKGQHPWQLNQILGNVWEWTQDCYEDNYQHATTDDRARGLSDANECAKRSLRGGAWGSGPVLLRSANRGRNSAGVAFLSVGFRLARTD